MIKYKRSDRNKNRERMELASIAKGRNHEMKEHG
jgi:hypothetical protein